MVYSQLKREQVPFSQTWCQLLLKCAVVKSKRGWSLNCITNQSEIKEDPYHLNQSTRPHLPPPSQLPGSSLGLGDSMLGVTGLLKKMGFDQVAHLCDSDVTCSLSLQRKMGAMGALWLVPNIN